MLYPTSLLADALADRLAQGYGAHVRRARAGMGRSGRGRHPADPPADRRQRRALPRRPPHRAGHPGRAGHPARPDARPTASSHPTGRISTLALLLHDIGYVRGVCPGDRPGPLRGRLRRATRSHCRAAPATPSSPPGMSSAASSRCARASAAIRMIDAERIVHAIERTRFPVPEGEDHAATADEAGLVRAADLIGQLADPLYLRRAGALFHEIVRDRRRGQARLPVPGRPDREVPAVLLDPRRALYRRRAALPAPDHGRQAVDRPPLRQRVHGRASIARPRPRAWPQSAAGRVSRLDARSAANGRSVQPNDPRRAPISWCGRHLIGDL